MNASRIAPAGAVGAFLLLGATIAAAQIIPVPPSAVVAANGVQVLTRGPVHEAFAETIVFDPEPGIIVMQAPPERIEELPPDQQPDGINVDWIPGYWAWDDERGDFLWISGVWRALPPGREWVPGYWAHTQQGHQWISGYWADEQQTEIVYLPEPPATVEVGPNIAPPGPDSAWIPGSWVWFGDRYAWRPGYWMIVQPDWDWIPAHYVCAPNGYLFVDGYWDYSVSRRGVLFAPIYVNTARFPRATVFRYSPSTVINISVFSDHLFVRPHYNHYYFGDYYAASYQSAGFYASFSFSAGRHGYDPIYAHHRWQHRNEPDWDRRVRADFDRRRDHENERPRRTLAAQRNLRDNDSRRRDPNFTFASSVEEVSRRSDYGVRFRRVEPEARKQISERSKDVQRYRKDRQRSEAPAPDRKTAQRSEPNRVKAHRSPIAAKSGNQVGKNNSPPKRPDTPQPDTKVERKSRKSGDQAKRRSDQAKRRGSR